MAMGTQQATKTKTLIVGGTGKTGRRVAARLAGRGAATRLTSRTAPAPFSWEHLSTWEAQLQDVDAIYLTYAPDIAVPGAVETVGRFAKLAASHGARRIVLLSGRGEEEAQRAEDAVRAAGTEWTILRSSWFNQNFSEGEFRDLLLHGVVALPAASDIGEPFVDADDIADVAVAALTEERHAGEIYELTGPRLLTFPQAIAEIAAASGRGLRYEQVSTEAYGAALAEHGVPADVAWLLTYLFTTVFDGRNARLEDGVLRALGRPPRDFSDYAREAAASGVWTPAM